MLKTGREALLISLITGAFGTLAVILQDKNTAMSIAAFVLTLIMLYVLVWKSMERISRSMESPMSHPVFYTLDNGIRVAFDFLPIDHEEKKRLVVTYMKEKFQRVRDALMQTVEDNKIDELPTRIVSAVADTKISMQGRAPKIFLDKMAEWDNKYNSWTMELLRSTIDSKFYPDANLKFGACLDCIQVMIKSTFIAAENSIDKLNGELEEALDKE